MIRLSDRALLALKLFALVVMIADHADWFLFGSAYGVHAGIGRTVFPIFAFVVAYNLAHVRPGYDATRVVLRMVLFGLLAMVPYWQLQGSLLPLNVMFTLALGVLVIGLYRDGWRLWFVLVIALVAGLFVDYAWFGIALIGWYVWALRQQLPLITVLCPTPFLLYAINGNLAALWSIPILLAAPFLQGSAPRLKWLFYVVYPAHLYALWAWSGV